jgi:IclR family acetate operon transcriptional repressor
MAERTDNVLKRRTGTVEDNGESRASVQSVDRALRLLELLSEDEEGYRLTDLAERSGLSPSTVHRLLTTLEERRFVQFDQSDGMWHVGRQAYNVGATFIRRRNFVGTALPYLRRLRDQTHETVNLAVADSGEIVILTQVESREVVRAITRPGGRAPMSSSGLGKAILAHYSNEEIAVIVQKFGLPRVTPNSIVRAGELREELKRVRAQGYAMDDEEATMGLRCVAAAIYDSIGEPICAISTSGPVNRISNERSASLGPIVAEVAAQITDALGGTVPSPASGGA